MDGARRDDLGADQHQRLDPRWSVPGAVEEVVESAWPDAGALNESLDLDPAEPDYLADLVRRQVAGLDEPVERRQVDAQVPGRSRSAEPVLARRLRHRRMVPSG